MTGTNYLAGMVHVLTIVALVATYESNEIKKNSK